MPSSRVPRVGFQTRRIWRSLLAVIPAMALAVAFGAGPALASDLPSGERILGQNAIEPAYNADTGELMYLLTPAHSPFPTHTSSNAVSPLYLVEYPPSTTVGTLNCMGVPGNFTNAAAANEHLTTDTAIEAAVTRGDAIEIDLGFAFHCSAVSAATYWRGR